MKPVKLIFVRESDLCSYYTLITFMEMLETGHVGLGRLSVKDEIFVYLFLFFKCLI